MGMAFGFQKRNLGFGSEIVSAKEAMKKVGQELPKQPRKRPKRRDKTALPMP